ncbi:MAG: Tol-Pal system beta propeller repeat protein TolB [Gammaproteobacteria bacterium]|nr:Tol-Pal system beta propeller repeat protein TolB [Gammaproteobacteria bacterium]
MKNLFRISLVLLLCTISNAHALLQIEITKGMQGALPIAIQSFRDETGVFSQQQGVAGIVADDLYRSGKFSPLAVDKMPAPSVQGSAIHFSEWRALGVDNLLTGVIKRVGGNAYVVKFRLYDVLSSKMLEGRNIPITVDQLRRAAHHISDIVYEVLTGRPGAFNTQIAYVTSTGQQAAKRYQLQIADADGYAEQEILTSRQPIMSPAWSPDGRRLAYVSFKNKRSHIYVQDVEQGSRKVMPSFPGINGAPSWSPDGQSLALTLSKDGNPEIYILNIASEKLHRLTRSPAIDTEPAWSPQGEYIVFTSDRGGKPQLYKIPVQGGHAKRISFEGNYNADASFSPDGKYIAMVHGNRGRFQIGVINMESGVLRLVSSGKLDESPGFSPNGDMIIFATQVDGRGVLSAISVDAKISQQLKRASGEVRDPSWSPYLRTK